MLVTLYFYILYYLFRWTEISVVFIFTICLYKNSRRKRLRHFKSPFGIHNDYKETFLRVEQFANDQSTVLLEKSFRTFENDHFRGQESWRAEGEEEGECGGVAAAGDEAGVPGPHPRPHPPQHLQHGLSTLPSARSVIYLADFLGRRTAWMSINYTLWCIIIIRLPVHVFVYNGGSPPTHETVQI